MRAGVQIDLAEMTVRAGVMRRPEFVAPPIVPTGAQRDALLRIYMKVVRGWGRGVLEQIMPVYTATLAEGVRDAPADVGKAVDDVDQAMKRLVMTLDAELEDWTVRVEDWHRGKFAQSFTPTGVNLKTMLGRGDVARTLEASLGENTALIRSLNDQMRNGISGAVFRGLQARTPAAEVAREIRKLTGMGRRRAELIAADQLQKLTGRLDQERQEQVGITAFDWAHSRKANPRPEHVARDGKRYRWDSEVAKTDPPGRAIRCGCRARAVLDLDAAAASTGGAITAKGPPLPAAKPPPRPRPVPSPPSVPEMPPVTLGEANKANDAACRADCLAHGRATGNELLNGYDATTGRMLPVSKGGKDYANLTPEMMRLGSDPTARIVLHHNHPSSGSFSDDDLLLLQQKRGVAGLWAHGHNGSAFYAERAEKAVTRNILLFTETFLKDKLWPLIKAGSMSIDDANLLHHHLKMRRLQSKGHIKYEATLEGPSLEAWERNAALIAELEG